MTDDRSFDELLEETMSDLPPDAEQTRDVTPWRRAMDRIIWGIGLTTLTISFWNLNYILPAIGVVLSWLGYRTLRQENRYFDLCWRISVYEAATEFISLTLNATIFRLPELLETGLSVFGLAAEFVQLFCLWQGVKAVRRKAGQPDQAGAVAALMGWKAMILVFSLLGAQGWLFLLPLLIAYIFILRSLSKVPALLDEAGYEVTAAPVRISDRRAGWGYLLTLLGCIVLGLLLCNRYPMEWTPIDTQEHAGLEEIKADLLELGMPEQVLEDLSTEDLAQMEGAKRVNADCFGEDFGSERWSGYLVLDDVAVELADGRWMIIHHFYWQEGPGLRTTECMLLWPTYDLNEGYHLDSGLTGRILYDQAGVTYAGDYYKLGDETYTTQDFFGMGGGTESNPMACFSLPLRGENCRGYLTYLVEVVEEGWLISSWNNYTHQTSLLVYPLMTAEEYEKSGIWSGFGGFDTSQTAIQFYPHHLDDGTDK